LQLAEWRTRCPGTARATDIPAVSSTPAPGHQRIPEDPTRSPCRCTTTATRIRIKTATKAATILAEVLICPIREQRPVFSAAAVECEL